MMSRWFTFAAIGLTMIVAGCSTGNGQFDQSATALAGNLLPQRAADDGKVYAPFDIATSISAAEVAAMQTPTIVAVVPSRDAWTPLALTMENGPFRTFWTNDQIALTLRDGVLVSSRGITRDLYASTSAPVVGALSAGGGSYAKELRHLTSNSELVVTRLHCTMTRAGQERITIAERSSTATRYEENCQGSGRELRNTYWRVSGHRGSVQSRQWVSDHVGYIEIYALNP